MKMVFGKLLHRSNFFVALWLVILLTSFSGRSGDSQAVPSNEKILKKQTVRLLSDGDLIFRKGRDLVSGLILTQGRSAQFSHVGMILKLDDQLYVVHALPEDANTVSGVQIEALAVFASFENATDIAVYRFKGIDEPLRGKLKQNVLQQVGKPFDKDFLMSTDDKLYCSELVLKAFAMAGIKLIGDIEPIKIMLIEESVILPDHLRRSPRFRSLDI